MNVTILDKILIRGKIHYLVQRNLALPSWEPMQNLFQTPDLLEQFEIHWLGHQTYKVESQPQYLQPQYEEINQSFINKKDNQQQASIVLQTNQSQNQFTEQQQKFSDSKRKSEGQKIGIAVQYEENKMQIEKQQQSIDNSKINNLLQLQPMLDNQIVNQSSDQNEINILFQSQVQDMVSNESSKPNQNDTIYKSSNSKSVVEVSDNSDVNQSNINQISEESPNQFKRNDKQKEINIVQFPDKNKISNQNSRPINISPSQSLKSFDVSAIPKKKISTSMSVQKRSCIKSVATTDFQKQEEKIERIKFKDGKLVVECLINNQKEVLTYEEARDRMTEQLLDELLGKIKWTKVQQ